MFFYERIILNCFLQSKKDILIVGFHTTAFSLLRIFDTKLLWTKFKLKLNIIYFMSTYSF